MSGLVDAHGPARLGRTGVAAFETVRTHTGYQSRYLRLHERRAYEVGNGCETCTFWFTRMEGANTNVSVDALRTRFAAGVSSASELAVEQFSAVLANEDYMVLLMDVLPVLTAPDDRAGYFAVEQVELWGLDGFWGLPHYPKVPYYRLPTRHVRDGARLFEFVVPMYPPTWLNADTLATYTEQLAEAGTPTTVALSVLDVKQPADWADGLAVTSHWCLSHYLLDGHHKLHAAAVAGMPVRLLSFLALNEGVSTQTDVETLVGLL